MRLLVYLTDGRTVYLIEGRNRLAGFVNGDPFHERESVNVGKGIWNPITGEYVWSHARLRYIRKASIAFVEEAPLGIESVVAPEVAA